MNLFELQATLGLDTSNYEEGINNAAGKIDKLSSIAIDGLKVVGKASLSFLKEVVETGMGFDKEMSAVQAVLGREEGTLENMNRLREFALDTARDSIFTAEETAEAYYYMGMAGWKADQMIAGLPGVLALAAASGEDLGKVSDIVTDSITAFGLTADDVSWYVDILAQTATNANTDVKRMGETFKYVAPIAGSLGADVDDVALAIGLMANAGIKGSMAGTALRNIFTRLSTNAGATKTDLGALEILTEKLGVAFWDTNGEMRDFGDIINEARVSWRGLTQEEQVYYAKQIGSQRGMAAWLALMNATDEEVNALAKSLANSKDAAQSMSDVKLDNLWGDIQMFNSSLNVLEQSIFDDVKGPMREVVQWATGALDRIRDRIDEDGLAGGIHQLGTEINAAAEFARPLLEDIGRGLAPVVSALVSELTSQLDMTNSGVWDLVHSIGVNIGAGLILGITDGLRTSSNPVAQAIYGLFGAGVEGSLANASAWKNLAENLGLPGWMQGIAAVFGGSTAGLDLGIGMYGDRSKSGLIQEFDTDSILPSMARTMGLKKGGFGSARGGGGSTSGAGTGRDEYVTLDVDEEDLVDAIASGVGSGEISSALNSELSEAGNIAASNVASDIQNALSSPFTISVIPQLGGVIGSIFNGLDIFAQGMSGGRILRGSTIFGMGADGRALQGGESGPEAVVGVNSLNQMIQSSVSSAVGAMLSRLDVMVDRVSNYAPQIYLDTGALVGGIAPNMNGELNDIARWKGYGRS